jgi:hypothetical protein
LHLPSPYRIPWSIDQPRARTGASAQAQRRDSGASRLQHISYILQVPVAFFFERAPHLAEGMVTDTMDAAPSSTYVSDFLATSDGLSLTKAFMRIPDSKLRRRIVDLVQQIAGEDTKTQ